jgi:hypothetical protein
MKVDDGKYLISGSNFEEENGSEISQGDMSTLQNSQGKSTIST